MAARTRPQPAPSAPAPASPPSLPEAAPAANPAPESVWNLGRHPVLFVLLLASALALLLHVPAFYRQNREGDELVYLELARAMKWDLSHYTTRESPQIRNFPYSIYRQPLFHHGPLYPLILKVGGLWNAPSEAGLLLGTVSVLGLLACIAATRRVLPSDTISVAAALLFAAVEPLTLFTTTRLLHDATSGILLAAGFLTYVMALESRRIGTAVWAGLLFSAALNMRFNCLVALPLIPLLQLFSLYRQSFSSGSTVGTGSAAPPDWWKSVRTLDHWIVFAVVMALVMTLGLEHFYRLFIHYGTISPSALIVPDADIERTLPIARFWSSQTRLQSAFHLLMMMPIVFLPFAPPVVVGAVRGLRRGEWSGALWGASAYLFLCWLAFSHTQLRYAAVWTPMLCLTLPWALNLTARRFPKTVVSLLAFTAVSSLSSAFMSTVIDQTTGEIVPTVYFYLPFLAPLYRVGWGA